MPAKSQAQFRAMQAAAHGRSNLGIPRSVAQEFLHETKRPFGRLPERKNAVDRMVDRMRRG